MFKIDIEKFEGKNDFNLWRENTIAHLRNMALDEALQGASKMSEMIPEEEKVEILKKVRNAIILGLSDQILRKLPLKCGSSSSNFS